jgi:hypothetical protein
LGIKNGCGGEKSRPGIMTQMCPRLNPKPIFRSRHSPLEELPERTKLPCMKPTLQPVETAKRKPTSAPMPKRTRPTSVKQQPDKMEIQMRSGM